MNIGTVDYSSLIPPAGYRCTTCGRNGCKLWRGSHVCADAVELQCCDCIEKETWEQKFPDLDANGRNNTKWGNSDQFYNGLPAVPTEAGDTYWGYTSVPDDGVKWWKRLPNRV